MQVKKHTFCNEKPIKPMQRQSTCCNLADVCCTKYSPAFKQLSNQTGKSFLKRIADFFKLIITKKTELSQKKETQELIHTHKIKSETFLFDPKARLIGKGISPEISEKLITEANGNPDHLLKLTKMYEAGFEPEEITGVFLCCKTACNKLSVPIYRKVMELNKNKVKTKHIPSIIYHFKLGPSKFDDAGYEKFNKLRQGAQSQKSNINEAFCNQDEAQIADYFFSKVPEITKATELIGEETFLYFCRQKPEVLEQTVECCVKLKTELPPSIYTQLKTKLNSITNERDYQNGEFSLTKNAVSKTIEHQNKIVLLQRIQTLNGEKNSYNKKNIEKKILNKINNLPYN